MHVIIPKIVKMQLKRWKWENKSRKYEFSYVFSSPVCVGAEAGWHGQMKLRSDCFQSKTIKKVVLNFIYVFWGYVWNYFLLSLPAEGFENRLHHFKIAFPLETRTFSFYSKGRFVRDVMTLTEHDAIQFMSWRFLWTAPRH